MHSETPRLLVVDDDRMIQTMLAQQLRQAGYDVLVARDGREALRATRVERPDVVLCDWVMPNMDGIAFCREVKADADLRDTYIAMLTSRSDSEDRVAGLDAGADDFLIKPVRTNEMLARVRVGLRLRAAQRELLEAERHAALVEMAVTLGHEVNNPLTTAFGHVELALQCLEEERLDRLEHHLRQIGVVASRIAEVARQLITIKNPKSMTYIGEQRMVDLDAAAEPTADTADKP